MVTLYFLDLLNIVIVDNLIKIDLSTLNDFKQYAMKQYLTLSFSIFFFLLSINVSGQVKVVTRNASGGSGSLHCTSNCQGSVSFELTLANLNVYNSSNSKVQNFPDELPPLYLELSSSEGTSTFRINKLKYSESSNGIKLYTAKFRYAFDLCNMCIEGAGGEFPFVITAKLITGSGNNYPACEYNGPNEIFDCSYFGNCDSLCNNSNQTESSHQFTIHCNDCTHNDDEEHLIDPRSYSISSNQISVMPNPFDDFVTISSKNDLENVQIILFDMKGRILQEIQDEKKTIYRLNTSSLERGVYILQAYIGNNIETYKILKK